MSSLHPSRLTSDEERRLVSLTNDLQMDAPIQPCLLPDELRVRFLTECETGDYVFIAHDALRILPDGRVYLNMRSAFHRDSVAGFNISAKLEASGGWTLWIPDCYQFSPMKPGPQDETASLSTWMQNIQAGGWRPVVEIQVQVGCDDDWEEDE